jgi:hypothetical protein
VQAEIEASEDYELLRHHVTDLTGHADAGSLIVEVCQRYYAETGKILSPKEALEATESDLRARADRLTATKYVSAKFAPAPPTTPPPVASPAPAAAPAPKAITNTLGPRTAPPEVKPDRPLTDAERLKRATEKALEVARQRAGA